MLGQRNTGELLDSLLRRSQAAETELLVMAKDVQLTRFANNVIHQNVSETNVTITVRVALGRRAGMATTNDLSPAGLDHVVQAAANIARLQPENPGFPGFPEPKPIPTIDVFDQVTAQYTPQERAKEVGQVCRRADKAGLIASGAFTTGINELAVANLHGVRAYHCGTVADFVTVVMSEDSAGYAADTSWRVGRLDIPALGREALDKALRSRGPRELPSGEYSVVLEPYAAADLVSMLGYTGMGALLLQEGQSWMDGRIGKRIMASSISIWDDGLDPNGMPIPFDFEGLPKQRVDLVKGGIAMGVVYDTATASREAGKASTGHALPPVMAADIGPVPLHLFMAPGAATLEEMIAGTERGLLITRFHYTRPVHPRDAVITGVTRDGTFLIDDGAIAYPVKNLRYTQSYIQALEGTQMVGQELKTLSSYIGAHRVPALKLASFYFNGTTQF